jgi:sporulation protein YlmC with PRC-barrel domain
MLHEKTNRVLPILALAAMLAAPAAAEPTSGPAAPEFGFMLTSRAFLGSRVLARDGTSVGTVGDLMIQASTGRVEFVAVDLPTGRILALPWRDVDVSNRGEVRLVVSRAALVRAPDIGPRRNGEMVATSSFPLTSRGSSTITGRVERWINEPVALAPGAPELTGVVLATKDEPHVRVFLAPASWLLQSRLELKPGDQVRAEGVELVLNGKAALVAYDIRTGDRYFRLRNADGTSLWAKTSSVARAATTRTSSGG